MERSDLEQSDRIPVYSAGYGDHNAGDNHAKETLNGPQEMHVF